ncbi:MAG: hypothetical protein ACUVXB_04050 [Bryobacteraceae bacterium]
MHIQLRGIDNLTYQHVTRIVLVKPGRYRFQISYQTESITTDQGVGIWIRDYANPSRLDWTTEGLLGNTGRRTAQLEFPVSAPAGCLS